MKTGDIVLIPFPFAELTNKKVRPAVVITITKDIHKDIVVAAISSVVPQYPGENEIILQPSDANKLRVESVLKIDRIVTLKRKDLIAQLGKLNRLQLAAFKRKFRNLVENK